MISPGNLNNMHFFILKIMALWYNHKCISVNSELMDLDKLREFLTSQKYRMMIVNNRQII